MKLRSAYIPHKPVQLITDGPSLVKQSMQEETNINTIMARYEKTGLIKHVAAHQGNYGDFVTGGDYHDHLNQIIEAREAFATLPATIRKRFDNEPAKFLEFVQDLENLDEMVEMGLSKRQPEGAEGPSDHVVDNPVPEPQDVDKNVETSPI